MPEILLYCRKCLSVMPHELKADYTAVCLGCYDVRDVPSPKVQMETMRRGKQEKRV